MIKRVDKTELDGVLIIEKNIFYDNRGYFTETYQQENYVSFGIYDNFVQDNLSCSKKGVIRGLHYQLRCPQSKLVSVVKGSIYDIAVDIRKSSPTFGRYIAVRLNDKNNLSLLVPKGFAHGFLALEDDTIVTYKTSDIYTPNDQYCINYNDPTIGISWDLLFMIDSLKITISESDAKAPYLHDIPCNCLFK